MVRVGQRIDTTLTEALRLERRDLWSVFVVALIIGVAAAAMYYIQGLTLSHYDSKAHFVVSRRIVDSMRPGWMQINGAPSHQFDAVDAPVNLSMVHHRKRLHVATVRQCRADHIQPV